MPNENDLNPAIPEGGTESTGGGTQEFDFEKSDNLGQIRDYAKGLKTDLGTYKPSHEFLESTFGGVDNAKLAHDFYSGFAGEEFDPSNFMKVVEQLSPQRASQLKTALASEESKKLAESQIEQLFGGKVSKEEIGLFRKFKDGGYGLGDGEDIPEALKFDKDGNPRSDEEIQFFRDMHARVKETQSQIKNDKDQEASNAENIRQTKIQENINTFSNERLNVLNNEFDILGLKYLDGDTVDDRNAKDFLRQFLLDGIAGAFIKSPEGSADYNSALLHLRNEEPLLAERYKSKIEARLLEISRGDTVKKLVGAFIKPQEPKVDEKPEISNTTGNPLTPESKKGLVTAKEIFKDLVSQGKIKV